MFHGLTHHHLYAAYRLTAVFIDDVGSTISRQGTAFFVRNKAGVICLITNRHNLDLDYNQPTAEYARFRLRRLVATGYTLTDARIDLEIVHDGHVRFSSVRENDVACIVGVQALHRAGQPLPTIDFIFGHESMANNDRLSTRLLVCDFVAFPGYPEWHDKLEGRPILRAGTISSDPRHNYSWTTEFKGECVAYEAFSTGGASGSPVIAMEKGPKPGAGLSFPGYREWMIIGINAGHLSSPSGHSGISYFYKSSAILNIIDS